jgi:hypothetical protein
MLLSTPQQVHQVAASGDWSARSSFRRLCWPGASPVGGGFNRSYLFPTLLHSFPQPAIGERETLSPTTQLHANLCIPTALAHTQHWRRRLSGDCGQPEVVPGDCVQPGNCSLHSHITVTSRLPRLPRLPCHLRLHLHHIVIQTITKAAAGDWLQPVVGSGNCARPGPRFFTSFY